jgi:hypothetical protein
MGRSRLALTHLLPSLLVLTIIGSLILFTWYPYPFLQFRHSDKFSLALILSAGLLGPALTWLVYKADKRALAFDLVIIILVQLLAVGWGVRAVYLNRPYFMVFALDRFDVLSVRDVDTSSITNPEFLDKPFAGPILLHAEMPKDEKGLQKLLREVMFEGKPDLQYRPEFWSPYRGKQQLVLETARPLTALRDARPESTEKIDKLARKHGVDITLLQFVPAMLANGQFAAILDARSGAVVDGLAIDPWIY